MKAVNKLITLKIIALGEVSLILCTDIEIYHIGRTDALY
jgi:hypothetical protein